MVANLKTLTLENRRAVWITNGKAVTRAREDRKKTAGRPPDDVKRLREIAAKTAAICGDCFTPLARDASISLEGRFIEHIPGRYNGFGNYIEARDRYRTVPICLHCWLVAIAKPGFLHLRGSRQLDRAGPVLYPYEISRHRCEACERPMRVQYPRFSRLPLRVRCCCTDCLDNATKRRANVRRRVRHQEKTCTACGKRFVPKQATAKTCSNTCRQKMFRQRRAPAV